MGHGWEFWQNVVHWKREWQTTSAFLPWEPLRTVALEKTLESPLDCKEIKPVYPKGDQPGIFIGRTDAEAPILWPSEAKSWLTEKDPDTGKNWRQEEKGDDRGWDGWMALLTWWTWVWVSSRSWWWTGRPGVLQSMELWRVGQDWETELNRLKTE